MHCIHGRISDNVYINGVKSNKEFYVCALKSIDASGSIYDSNAILYDVECSVCKNKEVQNGQ